MRVVAGILQAMSLACPVSDPSTPPPPDLLAMLQALQGLSQRMCTAAEAGDWATVAEMQETSAALVARLRPFIDNTDALPPALQACKQQTLLALLRDDARLRTLAAGQPEPPVDGPWAAAPSPWLH